MKKVEDHKRMKDLAMNKEISQLKNHTDNQQGIVQEDVKTFKKNFENVKENFFQDFKHINKTMEILCRSCPTGWMSVGLFCYYLPTDKLSWDEARDNCIQKRSTLLISKNKEEMDALKFLLEKDRYWIGLRRDTDPKKWRWLDGSMLSFSNWNEGEPNNMNTEDCVESWGKFNDLGCANKLKYVCMK
ncbi:CD209 antigen-like protein A [Phyllobates terribilis]|uniref:CD209 antigen-like protein A n=1 Tax=Phyllobates terribilis TaxID=111132 RepID=UPI003CCABDF3